jgi:uncharacterized protein (DUF924 family)
MPEEIAAVHQFWFGQLDEAGLARADRHRLWFAASPETDATIRDRFGGQVDLALAGDLARWAGRDDGLIALILLLDQFTRNIYRGTPRAFAGDELALELARQAVNSGRYQRLPAIHQVFLYMPLEHSEDLDTQEECVALFAVLAEVTGDPGIREFSRYAVAHREVIARFGRFPHRNAILGRPSTPEERDYLKAHGGF